MMVKRCSGCLRFPGGDRSLFTGDAGLMVLLIKLTSPGPLIFKQEQSRPS